MPTTVKQTFNIGECTIIVTGENHGYGPIEAVASIEEGQVCHISWEDRERFAEDIRTVIDKYRI